MWLLVKYSFDINDHIISLFLRQCASWVEFCACLTPFISLTSSLKLTWLQFDLYTSNTMSVLLCLAGCACIVERTSDVACSSMSLNSLVIWCSWWLHGVLSRAYLLLLCKLSATALSSMWLHDQWQSIFCVRQDLQPHQMLHHQPWRLRSLAQEPGQ